MKIRTASITALFAVGLLTLGACSKTTTAKTDAPAASEAAPSDSTPAASEAPSSEATPAESKAADTMAKDSAPAGDSGAATPAGSGAEITLAVNPWTGSKANANVAKVVLEKMGTPVKLVEVDENASWLGLDNGQIDANLEIWPSGHTKDFDTYITQKKTVVKIGDLGPNAKIGWYVPQFVIDEHPELATWEGLKDPKNAKLFATAESGDQGQFLMGDPSYVSYDQDIIKSLGLPLKYIVAGSETALITALKQAETDKTPLLVQFWQPHWLQSKVKLAQIKLPDVTPECGASATAKDGKYACDYPIDVLYKAASSKLEAKNAAAFKVLSKLTLTNDQQNEIAALIDGDGMAADAAAKQWLEAHADVEKSWMS
jgi:glycine betaine/proline transport system substrate-binding protein